MAPRFIPPCGRAGPKPSFFGNDGIFGSWPAARQPCWLADTAADTAKAAFTWRDGGL
jgi:hypothetical protein